jgi:hypothetical protein
MVLLGLGRELGNLMMEDNGLDDDLKKKITSWLIVNRLTCDIQQGLPDHAAHGK